jgi:hypothetical protein
MTQEQLPLSWEQPSWHPDYGDADAEFEHLRRLAEALLSSIPRASVNLAVPEPGLLYLQITWPGGRLAEAFSLCEGKGSEKRRYALILSPGAAQEEEVYADTVGAALDVLSPRTDEL